MKKYTCTICGFVYGETAGYPEGGIAPGTKWEDIPEDWICPLCGATKVDFQEQKSGKLPVEQELPADALAFGEMRELSLGELSALCSNLSKGCSKQYRTEEADLFNRLAEYYESKIEPVDNTKLADLLALIQQDLNSGYSKANKIAVHETDRGAQRALAWGEKVTRALNSLLARYETKREALLEHTNIYVCDICGFVYIGDEAPDICPVCKVPKMKLAQIQRG